MYLKMMLSYLPNNLLYFHWSYNIQNVVNITLLRSWLNKLLIAFCELSYEESINHIFLYVVLRILFGPIQEMNGWPSYFVIVKVLFYVVKQ